MFRFTKTQTSHVTDGGPPPFRGVSHRHEKLGKHSWERRGGRTFVGVIPLMIWERNGERTLILDISGEVVLIQYHYNSVLGMNWEIFRIQNFHWELRSCHRYLLVNQT